LVGTILAERYELKEKIGEGGMADVYTAHCQLLDRIVAVKILKEEFSKDTNFVGKFRTEALAAARLSHPNIVNIFDVGQQDGIHYIVMEYVEGETLQHIIKEQAPLPVKRAVDIALMMCYGMQQAHEKGIIHKDIKPHNILLTNQGTVKVADFGIAQAINNKTITYGRDVEGSVHYISPEQAKGEPVSPATDIYSLGCVLYEMLTGRPPFDAESMITIALKHIHDIPISPRSINPLIPLPLEKIILKALEKMPAHRYQNIGEMIEDLIRVQENLHARTNGVDLLDNDFLAQEEGDSLAKKKKRKLNPVGKILIIAAIIGFLSGIIYVLGDSFFGEEIAVPNIVGKDIKEANELLLKNNLVMDIKAYNFSDKFEKDTIISQKPVEGFKVKENSKIEVIVSKGEQLEEVPNLVGKTLSAAKLAITNAGFQVGKVEESYDDKYEADEIISHTPNAGSNAPKGSKINLLVSKGEAPERVSMPNLIGKPLEEAKRIIEDSKLKLGEVRSKESTEYSSNYVIEQNITAGTLLEEGSTINLSVSKGPGPVANTEVLRFELPDDEDFYNVKVTVRDAKGEREVYNEFHEAGDRIKIAINYFGSGTAEVRLNGTVFNTYDL
jgi:serine/threonine protein kinase